MVVMLYVYNYYFFVVFVLPSVVNKALCFVAALQCISRQSMYTFLFLVMSWLFLCVQISYRIYGISLV